MSRTPIWTLVLSLTLASSAAAGPTPEQKCEAAKLGALRNRAFCREREHQNEVLGKTPNLAKCDEGFTKGLASADKAAAKKSTSCRWLDNADGSVTDLNTGLQWELKTYDFNNPQNIHSVEGIWSWGFDQSGNPSPPIVYPTGPAFVFFLGTLNKGISFNGDATSGCFAGKCDWRLPSVEELRTILAASYPSCTNVGATPCTTIPGFTSPHPEIPYWTASTDDHDANKAWAVSFRDGFVSSRPKPAGGYTRAVRGEM